MADLTRLDPLASPIALEEVKDHLAVTHDDDDALLDRLIASAVASLDGYSGRLGRPMLSSRWRLAIDRFARGAIEIPMTPIRSVEAAGFVTSDGDEPFAADVFTVAGVGSLSSASILPASSWPSQPNGARAYIDFTAGYGPDPDDVPADLRHALRAIVATSYANRESVSMLNAPLTPVVNIEAAINRHRIWSFGHG